MSHGVDSKKVDIEPDKPATSHALLGVGQLSDDPARILYANLQDQPKPEKGPKDLRDNATLKDRPTTAAGTKGVKDLPSVLSQVGQSAVHMQNMYPMMSAINSIMASLSSGGSEEETTSNKKEILEDALVGALSLLIKKWTYDVVMDAFNAALIGDNINKINSSYREVVTNALDRIYVLALENGPENIPLYEYYYVETIGPEQTPLVTEVPDMYTQEYYTPSTDPYTGYIKWVSDDDSSYVFTIRVVGDKYFVSAVEEIYSIVEENLLLALDPYIENNNLTATVLNDLLIAQNKLITELLNEKTLGKGSGSGSNAQSLIQNLLGFIASASNTQKSTQLPSSVLNQSSIQESLKKFEKRQAEHKKMIKHADKALEKPPLTLPNNSAVNLTAPVTSNFA